MLIDWFLKKKYLKQLLHKTVVTRKSCYAKQLLDIKKHEIYLTDNQK